MKEIKKIKLTPRLQACADYVAQGAALADVGTDHAYLPVWLIQNGRVKLPVVACDISEGPLQRARNSAKEYDVEKNIFFALNNGLEGMQAELADTVVIAGMGGGTIFDIIKASGWDWSGHTLILQPMSKIYELRRALYENGFYIETERLVYDGGAIYSVLLVKYGSSAMPPIFELYAGKVEKKDELYKKQLDKLVKKFSRMEKGLASANCADVALLKETRALLSAALDAKKEYERA